jgi:hypothetical protein
MDEDGSDATLLIGAEPVDWCPARAVVRPSPLAARIHQAMVPLDLRQLYLEGVMLELRGKDLGDGLIHRIAYQVARSITWNAGRMAVEI